MASKRAGLEPACAGAIRQYAARAQAKDGQETSRISAPSERSSSTASLERRTTPGWQASPANSLAAPAHRVAFQTAVQGPAGRGSRHGANADTCAETSASSLRCCGPPTAVPILSAPSRRSCPPRPSRPAAAGLRASRPVRQMLP